MIKALRKPVYPFSFFGEEEIVVGDQKWTAVLMNWLSPFLGGKTH